MPAAEEFVATWPAEEQATLLLLGNLNHDEFLSLLSRCFVYLRTPECDGVAASVLESLALKIPVVASENGRRPAGVVTYRDTDAADIVEKLRFVRDQYEKVQQSLQSDTGDDNVGRMADWLVGNLVGRTADRSNQEQLEISTERLPGGILEEAFSSYSTYGVCICPCCWMPGGARRRFRQV